MIESASKPQPNDATNTIGELLSENRAFEAITGATADKLIARHLKDQKYFAALAVASAELDRLGEAYETYARVAWIETIIGHLGRAIRSWKSALRFKKTAEAYTGLGTALFQQGDADKALDAFQNGLALAPENTDVLTSLSAAHLYLGEQLAARRFANSALRQNPERLESRLCRARADIALGNFGQARNDIDHIMRRQYKTDEARLLKVDLLVHDEEYENAIFLASQVCEEYPESRDCLAAFRRAFTAFDESARQADLAEFLAGLEHFQPLTDPQPRPVKTDLAEKIDIIIPVHNAWRAFERCFASLENAQDPRLNRIIIVDDRSETKTSDKLRKLAAKDDRITLITTPRRSGFARALALGVNESDASAFVALNSDTIVTPEWLEKLHASLRSSGSVAMAGPLSNNGAWQNYGQVLDAQGGFRTISNPSSKCREDLSTEVTARYVDILVPTHLIHGFCVLIDRKAYDSCNGIDETVFPEGYGEFQDFSIRLRNAGHQLLVAADCIVFHERGASLSSSRRAALSREGRKNLYDRYGALNYLCLESASIRNSVLDAHREELRPLVEAWSI